MRLKIRDKSQLFDIFQSNSDRNLERRKIQSASQFQSYYKNYIKQIMFTTERTIE